MLSELVCRAGGLNRWAMYHASVPHYSSALHKATSDNLMLLRDAVLEYSEIFAGKASWPEADRSKPSSLYDLFNLLYHHQFLRSRPPPTSSFPEPLLDFLLSAVNENSEGVPWYTGTMHTGPIPFLIGCLIPRYNTHAPEWHPVAFTTAFFKCISYMWKKDVLLAPILSLEEAQSNDGRSRTALESMSPLPWSHKAVSRMNDPLPETPAFRECLTAT